MAKTRRFASTIERQAQAAALGGEQDRGAEFTIDRKFGRGFERGQLDAVRLRAYYPPTRKFYHATDFLRSVTWTDAADQAAVQATMELDNSDGQVGRHLNRPGMIFFLECKGMRGPWQEVLRLVNWDTEATDLLGGSASLQLYDHLLYLQIATGKNFHYTKDKRHKKGWTASEIALDIIKTYKIPVARRNGKARIAKTRERFDRFVLKNKSVYEALAMAYTLDTRKSKRSYFIEAQHGRVAIIRRRRSHVLVVEGDSNLRAATLRRTLTDRYNSVALDGSTRGSIASGPVFYVGDSLGVGTVPELKKIIKVSLTSDVDGGRMSSTGLKVLKEKLKPKHKVVVFDLGTNDYTAPATLKKTLNAARKASAGRVMIVLTTNCPSNTGAVNNVIRDFASSASNVTLLDWHAQSGGLLENDGVHATGSGYKKRAKLINAALGGAGMQHRGARGPTKSEGKQTDRQKAAARRERERAKRAARRERLHGEPGTKGSKADDKLASDMLFGQLRYRPRSKMPVLDPDWTKANAQALADKLSRAKKELSFSADGNFLIKQGSRIYVRVAFAADAHGKPAYFRKELFVSSITHTITPGDYSMDVTCSWRERAVSVNVDPSEATQRPQPSGGGGDGGSIGDLQKLGSYNMESLEQLAAGVGMANPHLMAAIAMAESGGNPTIYNGICCTGLWQINWPVHQGRFPGKDPKDPFDNAEMAASILKSQGLGAWEVYTNGMYAKYM